MNPLWFNEFSPRHSHAVGYGGSQEHAGNSHIRVHAEAKSDTDPKRSKFIDEIIEKIRKRKAPSEPEQLKEAA
jgi:hypothetical protein